MGGRIKKKTQSKHGGLWEWIGLNGSPATINSDSSEGTRGKTELPGSEWKSGFAE